ncbi:tyrosine-protein phosphatase Lar [Melanotaenia boesemani]|uniref:tyrosine-protein phosphatase Lar n=1 Tax=Melanotaenia boesemani TaxID=1250792 RepID=UPI001C052821|nr:tyrosine-protein phosphatase Lar [Melanotaenia boesemani]
MITFLDFLRHLMETFQCRSTVNGYITFMFLITVSLGSACEAPSSPLCYRRNAKADIYICEWSFNTNASNVMFKFCFNDSTSEIKCENIIENPCQFIEELLTVGDKVDIWVEAHVGNSITCTSPRRSGILQDTVKYETPSNISVVWLKNNLSLSWPAAEENPALVEVWFQQYEHPTESWKNIITNTINKASMYKVIIENVLRHSSYQVKIRHRSTQARNPLWSNWSPVIIVPAALEQKPEVKSTTRLLNGTREVKLTWKGMPPAAALGGVMYSLNDTQTSNRCPCRMRRHDTHTNNYTINVSYSAVNITIIAKNAAGLSPPSIIQIPASPPANLKICDKTLLEMKRLKGTCLEFYELRDADLKPENVMTLTAKSKVKDKKQLQKNMKDYIRYLYFEHICDGGKPQTVKMCLFYKKEGVATRGPRDFRASDETDTSVHLSWKAIAYEHQRGFITHYKLCRVKISSQDEPKKCFNISTSVTKHHLENLTPGSKYNISLAGVTGAGEGLSALAIINTQPEKPANVWMSFGLLFIFFFLSTMCTIILKRIRAKIFPPVPTPVIIHFPSCPQVRQEVKRKEEVHEFTLHQLLSEKMTVSEEAIVPKGEQDYMTDDDVENERSDSEGSVDECVGPISTEKALKKQKITDLGQVNNELAMLIYRNGLVFDAKTDSS